MRDHVELVKALRHCATVHDCTGCEYGCDANGLPRNRDLLNDAAKAIELPDHGDLIDRDALMEIGSDLWVVYDDNGVDETFGFSNDVILNAPVIVPSNKEETE